MPLVANGKIEARPLRICGQRRGVGGHRCCAKSSPATRLLRAGAPSPTFSTASTRNGH